jgi:RND family efflux transporter MFP subunit
MSTFFNTIGKSLRENRFFRRMRIVLAGLAIGATLLVLFVVNRKSPERLEAVDVRASVRLIEAKSLPFRLEARGHGVAHPAETWQATANVAGRVDARHPNLEGGAILGRGTELLALDSSRYELAIAEARSELAALVAEGPQLETEEANTRRLVELERQRLEVAEQELSRIETLTKTGAVSLSRLDEQRRATLAQRQAVASLENTLALLPSRREIWEARRHRADTRLAQAERDLEDTRFIAPYDLRLNEVKVELHQFVGVGQTLFEADELSAAEVEAHVPVSMMRRLVGGLAPADPSQEALDLSERIDLSAIDAEVEMVGAPGAVWKGRVNRIASGLDPVTRTVRVVVRVEEPYRDARPPERPPLQRGVYTRVRLSVASPEPLLAVPTAAIHAGEVYLVDESDRLERRPVEVAFEQRDLAVIAAGLAPGERVVVDDLPSAVQGMPLAPLRDEAFERMIAERAKGAEP